MGFDEAPPIYEGPESAEVMLADLNELRAGYRMQPVSLRQDLTCAAKTWAKYLWRQRVCGHIDPVTKAGFPQRVRECGGQIRNGWQVVGCNMTDFKMALTQWKKDPSASYVLFDANAFNVGIGHAGWDSTSYQNWYVLIIESVRFEGDEL